ncbi:MAG: beta-lactamase family protein [Gemmatimonadetes bacterium]|nr:beta-lactamase family protein [Gemmatimonadota bacterium]
MPSATSPSRLLLALTLAATSLGAQSAGSVANDPEVLGAARLFSAWMEGQIAYRGLPGIAVGVVSDQELVWSKGFGYADVQSKRPMTPSTLFRMASHSKLFTATAIMQLREQGKVRLDDPVSKHLPWFTLKPAGSDDGEVTIEQLLTHASGLPREAGDHWSTNDFPTTEEVKQLMANRQAAFPPATRWKYSNLAYTIAGMVVEAVSGQRWADYVQQHIYSPLGMTQSSVDKNVPGLTVGYGRRMPDGSRALIPFIDARGMGSATGITSNVEDMAKFASAQFRRGKMGGKQILSTGSLREMHRVRSVEENWTSGTGIGFGISRFRDRTYVGHGGGYLGNTTQTMIQLDDKVAVIVLTNTNDSDPSAIARQLMSTVGFAVAKAAAVKPAVVAWDPAWGRFAGLYRDAWGDQQVVLLNNKLVLISPNAGNVDEPTQLEPLGGGRFRMMARSGGGAVGEVVQFVEEGGRVTRLLIGDGFYRRVAP